MKLAGTEMLLSNLLKPWFYYCSPAVLEIHPFMFYVWQYETNRNNQCVFYHVSGTNLSAFHQARLVLSSAGFLCDEGLLHSVLEVF